MREISRSLAGRHYDRAFTLLTHRLGVDGEVAAAFLIESGVEACALPRDAKRAIAEARGLAA